MALDIATTAFLAQMASAGGPALHEMTPEQARGLGSMLESMYGPGPDVAKVVNETIPTRDGSEIPVRVLVPHGEIQGMIVYIHGGGWVIGALNEFDTLGRRMATQTHCVVVLVDYRLAPEHRFPTAVEDSWDGLVWAAENKIRFCGRSVPLVVAGDSAGGNLSAVMAMRARDRGGPELAAQVLVYPVTDCDFDRDSYTDPENQLMLSRASMIWFWDHYAPDAAQREHPEASPLRAEDLSGLPPAIVLTAGHDPLRDEGQAYAKRLEEAGVPVTFKNFPRQMHGFFTILRVLPGSASGLDFVAENLTSHLQPVTA